mmetsp:Transcript_34949/g.99208  ORF Transcript_34949/g.99208 Transcript_34949/m.99208 type:complete len:426 (-) Transcript_34949:688-1965(-)
MLAAAMSSWSTMSSVSSAGCSSSGTNSCAPEASSPSTSSAIAPACVPMHSPALDAERTCALRSNISNFCCARQLLPKCSARTARALTLPVGGGSASGARGCSLSQRCLICARTRHQSMTTPLKQRICEPSSASFAMSVVSLAPRSRASLGSRSAAAPAEEGAAAAAAAKAGEVEDDDGVEIGQVRHWATRSCISASEGSKIDSSDSWMAMLSEAIAVFGAFAVSAAVAERTVRASLRKSRSVRRLFDNGSGAWSDFVRRSFQNGAMRGSNSEYVALSTKESRGKDGHKQCSCIDSMGSACSSSASSASLCAAATRASRSAPPELALGEAAVEPSESEEPRPLQEAPSPQMPLSPASRPSKGSNASAKYVNRAPHIRLRLTSFAPTANFLQKKSCNPSRCSKDASTFPRWSTEYTARAPPHMSSPK